jgi:hypothetical protein
MHIYIASKSAFLKRLGRRLAEKWQRSYSQVMGFIDSRMAVKNPGTVCTMEDGAALSVVKL